LEYQIIRGGVKLENRHYKLNIRDIAELMWLSTGATGVSLLAVLAFATWTDNPPLFKQTYLYGTSQSFPF